MKLKIWLITHKKTLGQFAEEIDYHRTYISRVCSGETKPGRKFAKAVERATNGEIKAEDLFDESDQKETSQEVNNYVAA